MHSYKTFSDMYADSDVFPLGRLPNLDPIHVNERHILEWMGLLARGTGISVAYVHSTRATTVYPLDVTSLMAKLSQGFIHVDTDGAKQVWIPKDQQVHATLVVTPGCIEDGRGSYVEIITQVPVDVRGRTQADISVIKASHPLQ